MKLAQSGAAKAIGDKFIEMAGRVVVADKVSPGAAGQFGLTLNGKPFDVLLKVRRRD